MKPAFRGERLKSRTRTQVRAPRLTEALELNPVLGPAGQQPGGVRGHWAKRQDAFVPAERHA
jgi:hypothetical protein